MEKYNISKQLGDGTFGVVLLATIKNSGEKVAIKKYTLKCLTLRKQFLKILNLNSKNEKKVLFMGRVHEPTRNKVLAKNTSS